MLKRVSIQNFKSLKDVTLDLQKVNLLIGPNNSGKTNFLKALEFFFQAFLSDTNAIDQGNTYTFKKDAFSTIRFNFDLIPTLKLELTANVPISSIQANNIQLSKKITFQNRAIDWPNREEYDLDDAFIVHEHIQVPYNSLLIYKPDPNKLSKPGPVGRGEESVIADASNLIAFFDRIRDEYPESFAQIKADISKCVPEFTEINFQNVAATEALVKEFGDKTFKRIGLTDGRQKTIYWANELSEGTLYFIALLCIINQPNPPKLLLLEEPEKGIHPRRIEEVINFIFGLVDDKDIQVIMTTHSPAVVDMFKDMPESVFIFDKDEEGATHVKNLQRDIIEPETAESEKAGFDPPQYLNGLGEAWKVGFIGGVPR
ncbi:AAA family ATPase [Spirosoma aerolatum]|uniref:AAA family ATPase n=1 Tax=Spirosoma aerolatum TaxID=1211326 RepID=UPI0009AC7AE8|nr:ATP-binding protein [Spirosoma aerolatum]